MKKWTVREADNGNALSPDSINDDMRAQRSSITTLDRTQLPTNYVDETRLVANALHAVWASEDYPSGGEQTADADTTSIVSNSFIASTIQIHTAGWTDVGSPFTLSGFKGGNLYFEWSFNSYVNNIFARGTNDGFPGSPAYMRSRILINGIVLCQRRGPCFYKHSRIFGAQQFPPGDLTISLQFKLTVPSQDQATADNAGNRFMIGHLHSSRYLAVGRWR